MQVLTHHHNMDIKRNGPHFTFTDSQSLAILVIFAKIWAGDCYYLHLKIPI